MTHEYRTASDLRPIQSAAACGGTVHQLTSSEVDTSKSEFERGSVTTFPHGFQKGPLGSFRIFSSRDLSFGPKLTAQPKVTAEGARQLFYVRSETLRDVDFPAHRLHTAFSSSALDWKDPRRASRWIHPTCRTSHFMPPTTRPTLHHPLRSPRAILANVPAKKTSDASGRRCFREQFL